MSGRRAKDQCLLEACSPRAERAAGVPETFWPGVLQDAAAHKLTNLVLARWTQSVADAPPQIKSARRRAVVGNLAMAGSLLELLGSLEDQAIEALPFKGPLLAETVFGGLGNRSFGDLDILVPGEDLPRACELAVDLGYRPIGGVPLEEYLRITLRGGHHVCLRHERQGTFVELHWEMSGRYLPVALDFATVQPFLERTAFRGREVWNLNPEIGLLYLCVHGAKEYWRILDHVVCVAWHLERRPPDWDALIDLARRWGGMNVLLVGLGLAKALFAVQLPDQVRRRLKDAPAVHRLVARQSRRIFDEDRLVTLSLGSLPEFLRMHWTQLGNPRHFARWVVRKLKTPVIEELAPDGERGRALRSTTALAPLEALRRLLRGGG